MPVNNHFTRTLRTLLVEQSLTLVDLAEALSQAGVRTRARDISKWLATGKCPKWFQVVDSCRTILGAPLSLWFPEPEGGWGEPDDYPPGDKRWPLSFIQAAVWSRKRPADIARMAGVSEKTLKRWLKGSTPRDGFDKIGRLCEYLNVTPGNLLGLGGEDGRGSLSNHEEV